MTLKASLVTSLYSHDYFGFILVDYQTVDYKKQICSH